MAATSVLISVATLVVSLIIAILVYYIANHEPANEKKKNIEDVFSIIVNFIIFIWVGKIILNLDLFVKDPLAVLAYPSYSGAFYIAFLGTLLLLAWKTWKGKISFNPFLNTFISVFIFSSFFYEFIELVWQDNIYTWRYLTLLFALSMLYIVLSQKISYNLISALIMLLWGIGQTVLSIILPFTTVFGYLIATWFFILVSLLGLLLFVTEFRRKQVA